MNLKMKCNFFGVLVFYFAVGSQKCFAIYDPSALPSNKNYTSGIKTVNWKNVNIQYHQNYSKVLLHNNSSLKNHHQTNVLEETRPVTKLYPVYESQTYGTKNEGILKSSDHVQNQNINENTNRVVYKRKIERKTEIKVYNRCPNGATGQFVYDLSCNQFLNCFKGRGGPTNCAPGTLFNPKTLECDFPDKVECITGPRENSLEIKSEALKINQADCPEGFSGLIPNYTDCSKFINCNNGQQHSLDCPPGTLFDFTKNVCDFAEKANCFARQTENGHKSEQKRFKKCTPHDRNCYGRQTAQFQGQSTGNNQNHFQGQHYDQTGLSTGNNYRQFQVGNNGQSTGNNYGQYHEHYGQSTGKNYGQFQGENNAQSTGNNYGNIQGYTYQQIGESTGNNHGQFQAGNNGHSTDNNYGRFQGENNGQSTGNNYGNVQGYTYQQTGQSTGSNPGQFQAGNNGQSTGSNPGQFQAGNNGHSTGKNYGQFQGENNGQSTGNNYGNVQGYISQQTGQGTGSNHGQFQAGNNGQSPGNNYGQIQEHYGQSTGKNNGQFNRENVGGNTGSNSGQFHWQIYEHPAQSTGMNSGSNNQHSVQSTGKGSEQFQGQYNGQYSGQTGQSTGNNLYQTNCNPQYQECGTNQHSNVQGLRSGQKTYQITHYQTEPSNNGYQGTHNQNSYQRTNYGSGTTQENFGSYDTNSENKNYGTVCNINNKNCNGGTQTKPKCPDDFQGITKHPNDCSKFLNCANGITYVQDCAPGTLFNPLITVCDYPYNVKCESTGEPQGTTSHHVPSTPEPQYHYTHHGYHQEPHQKVQCSGQNCDQNFTGTNRIYGYHDSSNYGQSSGYHNRGTPYEGTNNQIDREPKQNNICSGQNCNENPTGNVPFYGYQNSLNQGQGSGYHGYQQQNIPCTGTSCVRDTNEQIPVYVTHGTSHDTSGTKIHGTQYQKNQNISCTGVSCVVVQSTNTRNPVYGTTFDIQGTKSHTKGTQIQGNHHQNIPCTGKTCTQNYTVGNPVYVQPGIGYHPKGTTYDGTDYVDIFNPSESRNPVVSTEKSWIPAFPEPVPSTDVHADYVFEYDDGEPVTLHPENTYVKEKNQKNKNSCQKNDFHCSNEVCVPMTSVCDNIWNCESGKDEKHCQRNLDLFGYHENHRLEVLEKQRWDNVSAAACAFLCMKTKTFECRSFNYRKSDNSCFLTDLNVGLSGALHQYFPCDYYELKATSIDCTRMHVCPNKKCLYSPQICDGYDDCGDRADEKGCRADDFGYSIRLAGSKATNEGRIEITAFGRTGYICDDSFGLRDANVVCKELGFELGVAEVKKNSFFAKDLRENNTLYMMDDVDCLGNETTLIDCQFSGWGVHNCRDNEIAGVVCKTPQEHCGSSYWKCETGNECVPVNFVCDSVYDCADNSDESDALCKAATEIRLANGKDNKQGRIEVKHHGIWGTICDDDFNEDAAKVVCKHLGYPGGAIVMKEGYFGGGEGPIWLDQVTCFGNESNLEDCTHWNWGEHNCDHSEDVGVVCTSDFDEVEVQRHSKNVEGPLGDPVGGQVRKSNDDKTPVSCGLRKDNLFLGDDEIQARVVQGTKAIPGDYPWQAALRVKGKGKSAHWCGAVVLSSKWVITAAHCLVGYAKGAYVVVVGEYNVDENEGTEQEAYIDEYYLHDLFRKGGHKLSNDIALVKLKGKGFVLNQDVQPICLPDVSADYENEINCTISGFGSVQTGTSVYSHDLRAAWVPIQKMETCKMPHVYGSAIEDGMICAGFLDGGVDACDGDSGGPLACLDNGSFTLYGITSWGQHCGYANKPGVYVKVAHYKEWIEETMKKHS